MAGASREGAAADAPAPAFAPAAADRKKRGAARAHRQRRSDAADPRSSILKLKGVELRQAASELLLAAAGPAALEVRHDDAPFDQDGSEWLGTIMPNYGILRAASIYGGSSEVQKGILAKSQLGV